MRSKPDSPALPAAGACALATVAAHHAGYQEQPLTRVEAKP